MTSEAKRVLALALEDLGVIKFGEFRLKSGILSPAYIDLRLIVSSPDLLKKLADALVLFVDQIPIAEKTLLCGVPYAALPVATVMSTNSSIPMVLCRKEAKSYGMKQMVEGIWQPGYSCVLVEDVITSGSSLAFVAQLLRNEGICVSRALVLVDREQGGVTNLCSEHKIIVQSLFTLTELTEILCTEGRITLDDKRRVAEFIQSTPAPMPSHASTLPPLLEQTLERSFNIPLALERPSLNQLISSKSSRLCVAIDLTNPDQLLSAVNRIAPYVCAIKLHLDILEVDSNPGRIGQALRALSVKYGFLIMEDRKFADIGQTVRHQLRDGCYKVAQWCDLVTVHGLPGPCVLDAIREVNREFELAGNSHRIRAVIVAQMSCKDNLLDASYTSRCLKMASSYTDVVAGFVCQEPLTEVLSTNEAMSYWVPGVRMDLAGDSLGQNYNSPSHILNRFRGDQPDKQNSSNVVLIVGRGITEVPNLEAVSEQYRKASIGAIAI